MKLRGDELGFIAVCSSSEFRVVFIWLRVVSCEERMGEVRCSSGRICRSPCYLAAGIC
jgi:hypothetical protein